MQTSQPWTAEEIQQIDDFLYGNPACLDAPLGAHEIDGYFCALISGPKPVSLAQALPWVYDFLAGEQVPEFASPEAAEAFTQLLQRQWHSIAEGLERRDYQPLFRLIEPDGEEAFISLDEWCHGYARAILQDLPGWAPALDGRWSGLDTILRFGTDGGLDMEGADPLSSDEYEERTARLGIEVGLIRQLWLAERDKPTSARPSGLHSGAKLGRNDPCHCGSGLKFKRCHGAA